MVKVESVGSIAVPDLPQDPRCPVGHGKQTFICNERKPTVSYGKSRLSWSALTAVAGSDGIRCVARAGYVLAHETLARYALHVPLYIPLY